MGSCINREHVVKELIAMLLDDNVSHKTKEKIRAWFWRGIGADAKDSALIEQFRSLASNPTPTAEDRRKFAELAARLDIDDVDISIVQRRRRTFSRFLARPAGIAASLMLLICLSGGLYLWIDDSRNGAARLAAAEVIVTGGYPEQAVALPDGSTVTLGRDATISYDGEFDGERVVTLAGQAKFDVVNAEDEAGRRRPFAVRTLDLEVHVLGTVFNVDATKNSGISRVALYEGVVQIHSGEIATDLRPGEALSYDNDTRAYSISLVPAEEMIRHGFKPLLRFDRSSLANLILSMEANFGVRFSVPPGIDMECGAISADFEGLSLPEIVHALSVADKQYSYRLDDNTITITNKKIIFDE